MSHQQPAGELTKSEDANNRPPSVVERHLLCTFLLKTQICRFRCRPTYHIAYISACMFIHQPAGRQKRKSWWMVDGMADGWLADDDPKMYILSNNQRAAVRKSAGERAWRWCDDDVGKEPAENKLLRACRDPNANRVVCLRHVKVVVDDDFGRRWSALSWRLRWV